MKLYYYDHCPFCTRARMAAALRNVEVEEVVLQNDDEETPIRLIGAKQVPILQKPDGSYMGESMDIVKFFDDYAGGVKFNSVIRPEVQAWFDETAPESNKLTMPRDVRIAMPEFGSQAAIDYFVNKKEKTLGSFEELFAKTDEFLPSIEEKLNQLDAIMQSTMAMNGSVGMEDILVFPILRKLTMVKALNMPDRVKEYVENMSRQTKLPLFFERAI